MFNVYLRKGLSILIFSYLSDECVYTDEQWVVIHDSWVA